jgi:hypothetical protein
MRRLASAFTAGWWRATGKALVEPKGGFDIAAEKDKDHVSPDAAAGPEGAFLVVYSEIRGPDDTKVLARVVK